MPAVCYWQLRQRRAAPDSRRRARSRRYCSAEIARVVKPGGSVLKFDKFLRRGQPALLRRLANPLVRRVATRLDVVFEDLLREAPELALRA